MFIEILFKMLLFKGGVLIYTEHCIYISYIYISNIPYITTCCSGGFQGKFSSLIQKQTPANSVVRHDSRSPVRTLSPRQPSGKDPWNQWTTYTLTLLQLEQTTGSSGQRGTGPPTEPGFSQGFWRNDGTMEFSFLAAVASGLLSWGHFISSKIIDLIAQILFKPN